MKNEPLIYMHEGIAFRGHLVFDDTHMAKRPAVMVIPAIFGLNAYAKEKAEALAKLGFVGFGVDVYGEGKEAATRDEAKSLMIPLLEDRSVLRSRLGAALGALKALPIVDARRICVIGYCFGGTCALEMAKAGEPLCGAVSIHGVLGNPHKLNMRSVPTASPITTPLLILHGYQDTYVSPKDVIAFEEEMARHHADWQFITYGQAGHAFANPEANDPKHGLHYHEQSDRRSWRALLSFFEEIFKE